MARRSSSSSRGDNGVIARDGQVPWRIREDLQRFVGHTMGTPMIMGRKTFDSFRGRCKGRPAHRADPRPGWSRRGAEVAHSVAEALALAGTAT
jgi:dihydrofolate reductase